MSTLDKPSIPRRQFGNLNLNSASPKKKFTVKKMLPKVHIANKKRVAIITLLIMVVGAAGGGYWYYENLQSQNPAVIYAKKLQSITDLVNKQFPLPTDEKPVIATVSNVSTLPKEAFFQNAQDGDKILIYKKHKEAVLYRPSTNQVITYAMLDFRDIKPASLQAVAGASTSAQIASPAAETTPVPFVPHGKVLVQPQ